MTLRPFLVRTLPTLAACLCVPAASGATRAAPTSEATTASYRFTLTIGMPEQMWTPAQVRAKHPASGEVMLMGSMGAMAMGGSERHLEVHIYERSSGKVVAGARPTITVTDLSGMGGMTMKIPVAEMEGVNAGAADIHYGNNLPLVGGDRYKVVVTLAGQRAVLEAVAAG